MTETVIRPPIPRRQKGKTLDQDGLQEALDSSPDVLNKGTAQFFTPKDYARVFALPLSPVRPVIFDPHCGDHSLLSGASFEHTKTLLGTDLDRRSQSSQVRTIIGDLNNILPLMQQAKCYFDLLVMNPPFGLRWPAPEVSLKHRRPSRVIDGVVHMDSVQASWLIALDRLSEYGEGMMIAPQPVVEKLIVPCPTYSRVWMHVTLPQFFPGVRDTRKMAVLYFAKKHRNGGKPCKVNMPSSALQVVAQYMRRYANQRPTWLGKTERIDVGTRHMRDTTTPERFLMVREEWEARKRQNRPKFNIWLGDNGYIGTHLSGFDQVSRRISKDLARALHGLRGRRPVELVLTKSDRLALLHTVREAGWKVDPKLIKAVEYSVQEYHRSRTPFTKPTLAMRVAWAEEEDRLTAANDWLGFKAGETYRLTSDTFEGRKIEFRENPDLGEEEVLVSGQELMICVNDSVGQVHGFTQYALDKDTIRAEYEDDDDTCRVLSTVDEFHSIRDLMLHFNMPDVPDIAEVSPDLYQHYRNKLKALET